MTSSHKLQKFLYLFARRHGVVPDRQRQIIEIQFLKTRPFAGIVISQINNTFPTMVFEPPEVTHRRLTGAGNDIRDANGKGPKTGTLGDYGMDLRGRPGKIKLAAAAPVRGVD